MGGQAVRSMTALPERATHQQTRAFNQQLVLRAIYDRNEVSRAEVARVTGLTRTSVGELVGDLLSEQLIEEIGRGPSTGGKAPILVRVRADGRHLIGLDLGKSAFNGAVVDLRGNIIRRMSVPLQGQDGDDAVELVYALISGLVNGNGSSPLLGIGVGAPGLVDSRTGTVRWAVNLAWENLPLGKMIEQRFGVPVVVANDSQAAAVAELTFGRESRPGNLVVVRVGRGIGAGHHPQRPAVDGDGSGAGRDRAHDLRRRARAVPLRSDRLPRDDRQHARDGRLGHRLVPTVTDEAGLVAALQRRKRQGPTGRRPRRRDARNLRSRQ